MTDNEIIKALECCQTTNCKDCVYCGCDEYRLCVENLLKDTLNLINRQQAEIERLSVYNEEIVNRIRKSAIKEFAEKLKEKGCELEETGGFLLETNDIDNLAKEMGCGE